MAPESKPRLAYIDWMRGLACVMMFQTHCYDSWLGEAARDTPFFRWSQLLGTLPAPLFLFLAGVSFALVTNKMRQKGIAPAEIARTTILRGAEIFGLGLLFRVQEFLLGQPWAPWTDLCRVDILNMIGFSMILMGMMCRFSPTRARSIAAAIGVALGVALVTPPMWTTWRVLWRGWLPWPFESYLNGVHIFPEPQPWLFPIFPWTALAFAGLATGFVLFSRVEKKSNAETQRSRKGAEHPLRNSVSSVPLRWVSGLLPREQDLRVVFALGGIGVVLVVLALWLDALPMQLYAVYDYWHTSPNFFLIRVGILLMILLACYVWCRWGAGEWGFSPMVQLGQTSLLVYWVHIAFVYGRFSILSKRGQSILSASLGLLTIFLAMLLLSLARTRLKGKGAEILARLRPQPRAAE